jgi:hypothetical protein
MTAPRPTRSLRDITLAALPGLAASACGDKDGGTTGTTGTTGTAGTETSTSTGTAGTTGTPTTETTGAATTTTTGDDSDGCLDSWGDVFDCSLDDPMSCPEGQVCVDLGECGCTLLLCEDEK